MNDREYREQKRRINRLIKKWVKPIGLGHWRFTFEFARDDFEQGPNVPAGWWQVAQCVADWRYQRARITFNMPAVKDADDEMLESHFVHELMHVFLHETRESGEGWLDHEERVATALTSAFLWIREASGTPR